MTQQYLRTLSLVVANPAGAGLELGSLRVVFTVRRGDTQTPNACDARIYNLADKTANQIDKEFTQLVLKAGYQGTAPGLIFKGAIKQVRKGREDQRTTYVDVTAADGDEAYNFSYAALTLAAGASIGSNYVNALSGVTQGGSILVSGTIGGNNALTKVGANTLLVSGSVIGSSGAVVKINQGTII